MSSVEEDEEFKAMGIDHLALNATDLWNRASEDERLVIAETLAMARQYGYSLAREDSRSEVEALSKARANQAIDWFLHLNHAMLNWASLVRHNDAPLSTNEELTMGLCSRLMVHLVEELMRDED